MHKGGPTLDLHPADFLSLNNEVLTTEIIRTLIRTRFTWCSGYKWNLVVRLSSGVVTHVGLGASTCCKTAADSTGCVLHHLLTNAVHYCLIVLTCVNCVNLKMHGLAYNIWHFSKLFLDELVQFV